MKSYKSVCFVLLVSIIAAFLIGGCAGTAEVKKTGDKEETANIDENKNDKEETESKVNSAEEKDTKENASGDDGNALSEEEQKKLADAKYDYSGSLDREDSVDETDYSQFANKEFYFSSGAGGWCTVLYIAKDGGFHGTYYDGDMGSTGPDYPNGTYYFCDFTGSFGKLEKIDEFRYKTNIEDIKYAKTPGDEEIKNGMLYVYTDAYGLDEPEDIYLCLPGMPASMLTEDERIWVMYSIENDVTINYVLINHAAEEAFSGYDIVDREVTDDDYAIEGADGVAADGRSPLEIELEELEIESNNLIFELYNSDYSQTELNSKSYDIYKLWDDKLNELYARTKELEYFDSIRTEQRIWLEYKEKRVAAAGAQFEGGSMQPYIENMEGYKLTKQRVYELAEYIW